VTNYGDLLRILEIEPSSGLFKPETVEIDQVLQGESLARGDDSAPLLLLGDSFTNIYRLKEMEWGEGAGLGEQLSLRLGVGVQIIAINGGGATAVRENLAQRPAAIGQKKVVVWACSARDLYDESIAWERVPPPKPN
jgi:alginate O-acetyltransferase complex protein AlgJ